MLVGIREVKGSLERHKRIQGDNTKMDLRGTGLEGVNWIHVAQVRPGGRLL
jgi:hypothetical protein